MRRSRSIILCVLATTLLLSADPHSPAMALGDNSAGGRLTDGRQAGPAMPSVAVRADSGAVIKFWTQNGETVEGVAPQRQHLPHLVLHRNGALAAAPERTVAIGIAGIPVPEGGVTVTIEIITQHADPDRMAGYGEPILVWREERRLPDAGGAMRTGAVTVFTHTFGASVTIDGEEAPTPTDYFRYRVSMASVADGGSVPQHELEGDYAFLMENQWLVPLPDVREASTGAAPDELLVCYCDMFPFRKGPSFMDNLATGLLRSEISGYVRAELIPAMIDAFRTQSDIWGFLWHDAWTSYRTGENAERLSVALTDGQTWFHGSAPVTGHSGISLNTNAGDEYAPYDTLTDALVSTFHHEIFHNLQRSINQHLGGDGRVDADREAWRFFSEGTALLASSVGLPEAHFSRTASARRHVANANAQLDQEAWESGTLFGSHGALYWRFLYEQCGGTRDGIEDPAAGMAVVRNALSALYSGDLVDITSSADLPGALPGVVDRALAETPSCPFRTFEESLSHFARAL